MMSAPIRAMIVDDEPLARRGIALRLGQCPDFTLIGQFGDVEAATVCLDQQRPDLVLLDIQLPGRSGLEWIRSLAPAQRPHVILLTAHAQFALEAFALDAIDYLLKPIDDERFDDALGRARRRLRSVPEARADVGGEAGLTRAPERYAVRVGHMVRWIALADLRWVQADGDYVQLHTAQGHGLLRRSLQQLQAELEPEGFVRVHRSTLVRVEAVAELRALTNRDALVRTQEGAVVRVSRTYVDGLRARLQGGRT